MRNPKLLRNRPGFTLVEILVAMIIFAILAAFVIPDVIDRADDADAPRVLADVSDITTAVELFRLDLKNHLPQDIEDLTSQITVTDANIRGIVYTTPHVNRWQGPYLKAQVTDGGSLPTGYNGTIGDDFALVDVNEFQTLSYRGGAEGAITAGNCTNNFYLSLVLVGLDEDNFEQANDYIDGTEDGSADGSGAGQSQLTGKLRLKKSTDAGVADPDTTFYVISPCV